MPPIFLRPSNSEQPDNGNVRLRLVQSLLYFRRAR